MVFGRLLKRNVMWTKRITLTVGLIALWVCLAIPVFSDQALEFEGIYRSTDDGDFSSLQIRVDGSFLYESRGDSCWTWTDIQGNWNRDGSVVTLSWDVEFEDDSSEVVCHPPAKRSRGIHVEILNPDNAPIPGVVVTINHRSPGRETDTAGAVVALKEELVNGSLDVDSVVEWIEVVSERWEPGQDVPPGYWSVGQSVDCPAEDFFTVVIDREAEKEVKHVTQRYDLENGTLLLMSSYDPTVEEPQYLVTRLEKETESK